MYKTLPIFFWLCVIHFTASAQKLFFTVYTESDGLVNNAVRNIFQDSKGFLWICTWEGLSKYDGYRFTNFTETNGLSHNLVNDVAETKNGDIYVAMNNGFVDLIRNNQVRQKGVVKDLIINKLKLTPEGNLLALTDNKGIVEIAGKEIRRLTRGDTISYYGLVKLNDSLMAAATLPQPVFVFDRQFHVKTYNKLDFRSNTTNCIYKDEQNRLWLGTSQGLKLVSVLNFKSDIKFEELPSPFNNPILSKVGVTSIFQQQNGNFWIGTEDGLINIRPDGQLVRYTEMDGLPSRSISCIFNDRENNLWIGTPLGIVKIIALSPIPIHFSFLSQLSSGLLMKKFSSEEMLINAGGHFFKYNLRNGETNDILQYSENEEPVYVGNSHPFLFIFNKQLALYDSTTNQLKALKKIPSFEYSFAAATPDNQTIFMGTFNDLRIYTNGKTIIDSSLPMRITSLLVDKRNYIWIGTWNNGLYRGRFDPVKEKWSELIHISQLPDEHIRSLFEDSESNIWIATRFSGIVKLAEKHVGNFDLFHLNQQTGLSSNWVRDVAEDESGNIWLVTMSGVDKLIKKNNYQVFRYSRIVHFITNANLITHIAGNVLWCSSGQGIFQITDKETNQFLPQQVYLTKVSPENTSPYAIAEQKQTQKITLPYSGNHVSFEFTSPVYLNEREILYSYRLNGSGDTAWSIPSNSHSVQYASLEPGHYRFEVRMLGWNGSYGPITSFLFTVKPPYWRTWWFYSLIAVAVLLLLYAIYRYRINQLLRLQKVRNNIATDLHDDIGSTLTNISILSELSKKSLGQPQVAEKYMQRITEESVTSQQALDDIIWSVNTRNDNMQELLARIRRYVAEVFESDNVSCQFDFDPSTEAIKLNMEQRRDVYLIFRECLNNIHKHASAKNIYMKIDVKKEVLNILIKDDGKGFDPYLGTNRNGLKNLKARTEKWKGSFKIDSQTEAGTAIKIMMPVKTSLLK